MKNWKISDGNDGECWIEFEENANTIDVCCISNNDEYQNLSKDEKETAHLIAAAPELLEALEAMVNSISGVNMSTDDNRKLAYQSLLSAQLIIKKAKGEQNTCQ